MVVCSLILLKLVQKVDNLEGSIIQKAVRVLYNRN